MCKKFIKAAFENEHIILKLNKPNYKYLNFILKNIDLKYINTIQLFEFRFIIKLFFLRKMNLYLISIQILNLY